MMFTKVPLWFGGFFLVFFTTLTLQAQLPGLPRLGEAVAFSDDPVENGGSSPSDVAGGVHPDLVMHLNDLRRYEESRSAARQVAVEKAEHRRARLAASRWYGHSPLRPVVSSIPMMGNYFPTVNSDASRPAQWFHVRSTRETD